jgi:hypothetical protein
MNKRKGFFRLTLVLSLVCGGLGVYFWVIENSKTFEKKKIGIPISAVTSLALNEKLNWTDDAFNSAVREAFRGLIESEKKKGAAFWGFDKIGEDEFFNLSPREKQKIKENVKKEINYEKETGWRLWESGEDYFQIPFGYDWTKITLLILIGFTSGFAPVWLIYAFIKWVVIGFIAGGFKDRNTP